MPRVGGRGVDAAVLNGGCDCLCILESLERDGSGNAVATQRVVNTDTNTTVKVRLGSR